MGQEGSLLILIAISCDDRPEKWIAREISLSDWSNAWADGVLLCTN